MMSVIKPIRTTPIFDQRTLPRGVHNEYQTKAGEWGIVRVLEGTLCLHLLAPVSEVKLDVLHPGLLLPEQLHFIEAQEPVRMRLEFYNQ
ncbi:MAG: DUF1971 domain-containing protein [Idiomarina sp.]|nr:DUF1971 domain-containing protein [Idiomarina sp.]